MEICGSGWIARWSPRRYLQVGSGAQRQHRERTGSHAGRVCAAEGGLAPVPLIKGPLDKKAHTIGPERLVFLCTDRVRAHKNHTPQRTEAEPRTHRR